VYIYDPSYLPPETPQRRNLKTIPLTGTKAYTVIGKLKKRNLLVEEIWIGGGGNEDGRCREMSLEFIKTGVEKMMTLGVWEPLERDWEKVSFA
jgi:hypothetical protein